MDYTVIDIPDDQREHKPTHPNPVRISQYPIAQYEPGDLTSAPFLNPLIQIRQPPTTADQHPIATPYSNQLAGTREKRRPDTRDITFYNPQLNSTEFHTLDVYGEPSLQQYYNPPQAPSNEELKKAINTVTAAFGSLSLPAAMYQPNTYLTPPHSAPTETTHKQANQMITFHPPPPTGAPRIAEASWSTPLRGEPHLLFPRQPRLYPMQPPSPKHEGEGLQLNPRRPLQGLAMQGPSLHENRCGMGSVPKHEGVGLQLNLREPLQRLAMQRPFLHENKCEMSSTHAQSAGLNQGYNGLPLQVKETSAAYSNNQSINGLPLQAMRNDITNSSYKQTDKPVGFFKMTAGIPMPYCQFPNIQDHEQQQPNQTGSSQHNNLPNDFPKLCATGRNLMSWAQQFQIALMKENASSLILNPPQKPWSTKIDCLHHKAFYLLLCSIDPVIYHSIPNGLTVYEVWERLYNLFYSENMSTTSRISRELHSAKLRPGITMGEHLLNLNTIRSELLQRGVVVSEESLISIILNSLDSSWDYFIHHLDNMNYDKVSLQTISGRLIAEDNLRRDRAILRRDNKTTKRVDFVGQVNAMPECFRCGSTNHFKRDCPKAYRSRENADNIYPQLYSSQPTQRPSYSHQDNTPSSGQRTRGGTSPIHKGNNEQRRWRTPSPRGHSRGPGRGKLNSINGVRYDGADTYSFPNEQHWLIDSGATTHTSCSRKQFCSFTKVSSKIRVANQGYAEVIGKGNVHIPGIGEVKEVLYVPEIPYNVLAAIKLCEDTGSEIIFQKRGASVIRNGKKIGNVIITGGLPYLSPMEKANDQTYINVIDNKGSEENSEENTTENSNKNYDKETEEDSPDGKFNDEGGTEVTTGALHMSLGKPTHDNCAHLLHRKLGHISFPVVKKMLECSEGLKVKDCDNYLECSVCKCSKSKVTTRPKTSERKADHPFQLLHMDLVGPLRSSLGQRRFFLTIVDDFSRYGFTFTLKHKGETFTKFKEFYKRVETQHNIRIKQIMTDRGSEFLSKDFEDWIVSKGMIHYKTAPFSAFQNGVAERRNGVLQTMIRCILEDAGLNFTYWGEALLYSNYTLNRLWSSVIGKTPYEAMYDRKPKLSHLHIFGVLADVHIPKQLRRKGEKISKRLRFLGYESGSKAYRFLDSNLRIVVSRSANFHENANWRKLHSNEIMTAECLHDNSLNQPGGSVVRPNPQDEEGQTQKTRNTGDHKPDPSEDIPRRSTRSNKNKMPKELEDFVMAVNSTNDVPETYDDILKLPYEEQLKWEAAMQKEMKSLKDLNVYTTAKVPEHQKAIGTRWVFRIKPLEDNKTLYKARLVAQGFSQRYPDDYDETYSPTVRPESVKAALVMASILKEHVYQFDVQTAYLHAQLDKEIYVRALPGVKENEGETWLLNKSLYGLKQSGKRWYECLSEALERMGFAAIESDRCVFIRRSQGEIEKLLVYVDDLLYFGKSKSKCEEFTRDLQEHFSLKVLGKIDKYLGVQISEIQGGFTLSQKEKIVELLERCNMADANPCETPMQTDFQKNTYNDGDAFEENTLYRSTIGSLLYIASWTRPDITLAVNLLSRHQSNPKIYHWNAIKRLLRYLKHTMDVSLILSPTATDDPKLSCYADADWAGDTKTRRSTSGYLILLNNSPIYWYTGRQKSVATSTADAEYACLSMASNNLIWFNNLISEFWKKPLCPITIHEDNKAAIDISRTDAVGHRSRHIDIKYKHVRQMSKEGFINVVHCDTKEQTADILTKPLPLTQHLLLCKKICLSM